jgi:Mn2+/Fe2+ NRAMP family transporter
VLLPISPFKALIWSAVLNGVIVVPIIGAMMIVASRREIMGEFTMNAWQRVLGWLTLVLMAAAAIAMFVLM